MNEQTEQFEDSKGDYNGFRRALGYRESRNNYSCKNAFGYLGYYQFGKERLYDLGYSLNGYHPEGLSQLKLISAGEFLKNPELQDALFFVHVARLKAEIEQKYSAYINKPFTFTDKSGSKRTIQITLSGLVAGAHLKGTLGLKSFFTNARDNYDGLNTAISSYIEKFGGYKI